MKQLNLITFITSDHKPVNILKSHADILKEIEQSFTVKLYSLDEIDRLSSDDFVVLFMTKGGIESLLIHHFERLAHPLIMLADDYANSLPAAMEVGSWLRQQGFKCEVVYGNPTKVVDRLNLLYDCYMASRSLFGLKVGIIGNLSPLLISSGVDYLLAKRRWGIEYTDIPMDEVYNRFGKITTKEVSEEVRVLMSSATTCLNCTEEDMANSLRLYHSIRTICDDYHLNAITLNCSKIYEKIGVTGCLTLSLLNSEGYVAGCEGDLQAIFTMIVAHALSGKSSFLANVNRIDEEKNEVLFTHCSICTVLTDSFNFVSHFETKKSVSIQGYVPTGKRATIVRCGGECLDSYYVSSGTVVDNFSTSPFNTTEINIKLDTSVDYFMNNPLGNHHIVIFGDYVEKLNTLLKSNSCKRIL
jgi:L-fucose isomerase-like protein